MPTIPHNLGRGGTGLNRKLKTILDAFADDQLLGHVKTTQVTGTTADTAITLTGITTSDLILFGFSQAGMGKATPAAESPYMIPLIQSQFTISATNTIKIDVDTSDDLVTVVWVDLSAKSVQKA